MSQCILSTTIARLSDNLMLCSYGNSQHHEQERVLLKNLKCTFDSRPRAPLTRITVDDGKCRRFFCLLDFPHGVVYFCLCNRGIGSSKLIFGYLDDLMRAFSSMFPPSQLDAVTTPFKFIQFDTQIEKSVSSLEKSINGNFRNGFSTDGTPVEAINKQLNEVQDIMRTNLDDLVMRGQKLETMQKYSAELREESVRFRKKSNALNRSSIRQKVVLGLVCFLLFIYVLFFRGR
ncbi:cyclin 11 [Perkinsela sp. CCAP 1560/4]|nr:cyclin 11 [Perkinsela sp. CCAP 1560/4]|eukprot:KNH04732.1 cyclin 11 [Perkinsela sp. CCAP 1560/4]